MAEEFDPYYRWLGIRPEEQPANHYRLLGISPLESDADVIANAADRQMAHVRSYQLGPQAARSQRLLNELAAARVCLLNLDKKAEYDAWLRLNSAERQAPPPQPMMVPEHFAPPAPPIVVPATPIPTGKRPASSWGVLLTVGALMLIAAGLVLLAHRGSREKLVQFQPDPQSAPLVEIVEPGTTGERSSLSPPTPEPKESRASRSKPVLSAPKSPPQPERAPPEPAPVGPPTSLAAPPSSFALTREAMPVAQVSQPKPDAARLPIPEESVQAKTMEFAQKEYGVEYAGAKTAQQKTELARKLIQKARESEVDASGKFVLLRLARDIAVLAADAVTTFEAVEVMTSLFQVDALSAKTEALSALAEKAQSASDHQGIAAQALPLVDQAIADDRYDAASPLCHVALAATRPAGDPELARQARQRSYKVQTLRRAYAGIREAAKTLEAKPLDPEANLAVGKFLCLVKEDWDRGLPKLALGNDLALQALASQELKGPPTAGAQAKLADAWWNLAESQSANAKQVIQRRAVHWYWKALPGLSGADEERVRQRVATVERVVDEKPTTAKAKPARTAEPPPSAKLEKGWISIFDGRSLKGWQADQNVQVWSVVGGAIVGDNRRGRQSHLYYQGQAFRNFEARADVNINSTGNSGLYFRAMPAQKRDRNAAIALHPSGYEAQIVGTGVPGLRRTGSLFVVGGQGQPPTVRTNLVRNDEWFTLRLVAQAGHVVVSLNENQVVDYADPGPASLGGYIALQVWTDKVQGQDSHTRVAFRNLQVKPLP